MSWTIVVLSSVLLAQLPETEVVASPTPESIVAGLLTPSDGQLDGQPLSLGAALALTGDRQRQLDATHAYWRLVEAVAARHGRAEAFAAVDRIAARPADELIWSAARTSATAALRLAELTMLAAQYDLAELTGFSSDARLPMPTDVPLVGTYQTGFDRVFARHTPPARTRWINRNLPLRRQAIEARAAAVAAADTATVVSIEAYGDGSASLAELLSSIERLVQQRRSFIGSVCLYNHDIADYALLVAGPGTDAATLVAMLIKTADVAPALLSPSPDPISDIPTAGRPTPSVDPTGVRQATRNEPVAPGQTGRPTLAPPRKLNVPTLAPPRTEESMPDVGVPNEAVLTNPEARRTVEPSGSDAPFPPAPVPGDLVPLPPSPSTMKTFDEIESEEETAAEPRALVPVPGAETFGTPRAALKPLPDLGTGRPLGSMLYPALVDAAASARTGYLTRALHLEPTEASESGVTVPLSQCLEGVAPAGRKELIGAFWIARQRAAEWRVRKQAGQFLDEVVLPDRTETGTVREPASKRFEAARLAAEADVLEANLRLLEAQFDLTGRAGRPHDSAWLLPTTIPHSGPYLLKLDAQPEALVQSWPMRRLAATIPALAAALDDRAGAVVEADTARASVIAQWQAGRVGLDDVLVAIENQTRQSSAFLEALTFYNRAIAEYALAVLPVDVTPEQLASTLVMPER